MEEVSEVVGENFPELRINYKISVAGWNPRLDNRSALFTAVDLFMAENCVMMGWMNEDHIGLHT